MAKHEPPKPGVARARSERNQPEKSERAEGASSAEGAAAPQGNGIAGVGYRVKLPEFEGPLDLLLHLIQQHELDILDIPIAFITEKYVEYVKLMEELNIDLASEYLVMAATLAHIKSKMLLPNPPADQEDALEEEADPRGELIRRLLEYQKYKEAAEQLATRKILGRDVFARPVAGASAEGPAPLAPGEVFKLFSAFQRILERAKTTLHHEVEFERFSISDRINQLIDLLRGKRRTAFEALFEGNESRAQLIVTFLAILEMAKVRLLRIFQTGPLEPIFVELDDDDTASATEADTECPAPEDGIDEIAGAAAARDEAGSQDAEATFVDPAGESALGDGSLAPVEQVGSSGDEAATAEVPGMQGGEEVEQDAAQAASPSSGEPGSLAAEYDTSRVQVDAPGEAPEVAEPGGGQRSPRAAEGGKATASGECAEAPESVDERTADEREPFSLPDTDAEETPDSDLREEESVGARETPQPAPTDATSDEQAQQDTRSMKPSTESER